jgi:hypothetical protein
VRLELDTKRLRSLARADSCITQGINHEKLANANEKSTLRGKKKADRMQSPPEGRPRLTDKQKFASPSFPALHLQVISRAWTLGPTSTKSYWAADSRFAGTPKETCTNNNDHGTGLSLCLEMSGRLSQGTVISACQIVLRCPCDHLITPQLIHLYPRCFISMLPCGRNRSDSTIVEHQTRIISIERSDEAIGCGAYAYCQFSRYLGISSI